MSGQIWLAELHHKFTKPYFPRSPGRTRVDDKPVVNLLPFALNKGHVVNYRNMDSSVYRKLINKVFEFYPAPKIKSLKKDNPNLKIAVRYARTHRALGSVFQRHGLSELILLWKRGGGIDKSNFRKPLDSSG